MYVYILYPGRRSQRALLSIVISAATAGFVGGSVSFDFDVDPGRRKQLPHFYGCIPDDSTRSVVFACMVLNSGLLLLIRSFSAALLILVGTQYFAMYCVADMSFYFFLKIVRGDFDYFLPIDGPVGIFASFGCRFIIKIVCDYTGIMQFRHAVDFGGAYWTGNLCSAFLSCFLSVSIYVRSRQIDGYYFWLAVGGLSGAWALIFCLFLCFMKKEYRKTFFSLKLGKDEMMSYFESEDDATKSIIVTINKRQWRRIEKDVRKWLLDNWERWEEEDPPWFNEVWKSDIDDDWLPSAELRRQKLAGGGVRRRSSLGEKMAPNNTDVAARLSERRRSSLRGVKTSLSIGVLNASATVHPGERE
jgi:hypothetical protein